MLNHVMSAAIHLERLGSEILVNEGQWNSQDNLLRHIQYCVTGLNHPVNCYQKSNVSGCNDWRSRA